MGNAGWTDGQATRKHNAWVPTWKRAYDYKNNQILHGRSCWKHIKTVCKWVQPFRQYTGVLKHYSCHLLIKIVSFTIFPVEKTSCPQPWWLRMGFQLTGLLITQTQDIFSLADAAWKHPKYPCFCILPLEFEINIDIHKHKNSQLIYSNRNKFPKEMSGNSRLQKHGKHVNRFHLTKCTG